MTHTLHRRGSQENLSNDFVLFAMSAKGINEQNSANALKSFLNIVMKYHPINVGDMKTGNIYTHTAVEILENVQDVSIVHAVFTNEETLAQALKEIKDADLGVSVVISGLLDRVGDIGKRSGAPRHTVECSGGIWGNLDKLASAQVLELTTMCGHGMVAARLVESLVKKIKIGLISVEEAALTLTKPCVCGVYNTSRAEQLLRLMVEKS